MLEDFLAFFTAPPGFDDDALEIDPSVLSEKPADDPLIAHVHAKTKDLLEDFCEMQTAVFGLNRGSGENKGADCLLYTSPSPRDRG